MKNGIYTITIASSHRPNLINFPPFSGFSKKSNIFLDFGKNPITNGLAISNI